MIVFIRIISLILGLISGPLIFLASRAVTDTRMSRVIPYTVRMGVVLWVILPLLITSIVTLVVYLLFKYMLRNENPLLNALYFIGPCVISQIYFFWRILTMQMRF